MRRDNDAAAPDASPEAAVAPATVTTTQTVTYPTSLSELEAFAAKLAPKNRAGIQSLPVPHIQAFEAAYTSLLLAARYQKEGVK